MQHSTIKRNFKKIIFLWYADMIRKIAIFTFSRSCTLLWACRYFLNTICRVCRREISKTKRHRGMVILSCYNIFKNLRHWKCCHSLFFIVKACFEKQNLFKSTATCVADIIFLQDRIVIIFLNDSPDIIFIFMWSEWMSERKMREEEINAYASHFLLAPHSICQLHSIAFI